MSFTEVLMPVSILGSFGTALYFFTKVLTDYMLKKKMIEKGYVNEETQAIFRTQSVAESKFGSLKWGLLALCGGIALIVMDRMNVQADSTLPYGILAVALSVGFLTYFFIVKREMK
jgi:ABC-type antimicrobial peptide transport system permease subunit